MRKKRFFFLEKSTLFSNAVLNVSYVVSLPLVVSMCLFIICFFLSNFFSGRVRVNVEKSHINVSQCKCIYACGESLEQYFGHFHLVYDFTSYLFSLGGPFAIFLLQHQLSFIFLNQ